jgi:hypothetical protein
MSPKLQVQANRRFEIKSLKTFTRASVLAAAAGRHGKITASRIGGQFLNMPIDPVDALGTVFIAAQRANALAWKWPPLKSSSEIAVVCSKICSGAGKAKLPFDFFVLIAARDTESNRAGDSVAATAT